MFSKVRARARFAAPLVVLLVMAVLPAGRAIGQETLLVTLEASRKGIDLGETVRLKGEVTPAAEGETITIIDQTGKERATVTTNALGRFKVDLKPRSSARFQAIWLTAMSEEVLVKVRPRLAVSLSQVRLFGKAKAAGQIVPPQPRGRVKLVLLRNGNKVASKRVPLRDEKRFRGGFRIRKPGAYKVKATFSDRVGATGRAASGKASPPLPTLRQGSRSIYVKLLERRLNQLGYHLPGVNRSYDHRTSDAMRAFNKIQGTARVAHVDAAAWHRLASPKQAQARYRTNGFHIEVDQTKQVLMMVRNGKVGKVLHVSTGANNTPTRNGTWRVYRKLAGYSPGRLYYPSYFDGLRAFHGWPEVPTYNASHGCVRVPMWSAQWVYGKAPIGTVVRIYH